MTFQQLKYVLAVANCGSINRAAEKMFVSQSGVSSALSDLEKEFNTTLFIRGSGSTGTVLTKDGQHFLKYAKSILDRQEALENFYSSPKNPVKTFSISSQHYQCVCAAYIKFVNQMSGSEYHFTYKECGMDDVIDDVHALRADLGIIITSNLTEDMTNYYLNRRNLSFEAVTTIQPCVFLSKSHPLASEKSLRVDDILKYPYVTFSNNQDTPIDFSEGINKLSLQRNRQSIITNDRAAMVNLLCNSNCVSTGSGFLLENISDGRLISIPLEDSMERMVLGWVKPKSSYLSEDGKLFLEILHSVVDEAKTYTRRIWDKQW